ncbi:MAG: radical SAM protein [Deltaproteobacteria bacterium]|nr:radical SAM protein [Deltaproteobacteria bacterium]
MSYKPSLEPDLYASVGGRVDEAFMDQMAQQDRTPVATDRRLPRVALVVGPSPFSMPRGWEFFLASPYEGVTYIATVLHNAGYPVRIIDVRYDPDPLGSAYRQVMEGTDVLGLATYEDCYPFLEELIAEVKHARPEMPVILGGSLVTSVPHVFMHETRADVAVISEGEITILELMHLYARGEWNTRLSEVRGIWYRDGEGQVHRNPARGQMPNLESLPRMRLDLWPQSRDPRGLQPQVIASYSRGCKMDCSFCYRTTPQERVKSPTKLRADLDWLKTQYGVNFVFFVDLTFTAHKRQTLEYLDVIREFDIGWTCLTRNADVDAEVTRAMGTSGCDIALYGVESLTPAALKQARKGSTENLVERAMRNTWDAGVRYGALTIVGLPGETEESLDHMCSWAERHNHVTRVKYLSAMPGTTVYEQAVRSGQIRSEVEHLRWLAVEQALERDEFLNYNELPDPVMRRAYKRLYDAYQPGPVMDFKHFPEHFAYYDPDGESARPWRREFSSAGGFPAPGWERFRGLRPSTDGVTLSSVRPREFALSV